MLDDFKKRHCEEFPLCSTCISLLCPRWRYETQYLVEQTGYLSRLSFPDALSRYQELEKMNTRLRNDVSAFQEVSRQCSTEIEKMCHPVLIASRPSEDSLSHIALPPHAAPPDPQPLACKSLPFCGLAFATAYRITTRKHYGCINDNRLGFSCPDAVPQEELDRAFFFVAHMVQALGRLARVETARLAVSASVVLRDSDEQAFVLTPSDLKNRKGVKTFEVAVKLLIGVIHRIFESQVFTESDFSPPHRVELKKQEVAGDSFVYDRKKPDVFTAAMKHLLFNLKYTQKWALQIGVRTSMDAESRAQGDG
jgi:hypothetical protein